MGTPILLPKKGAEPSIFDTCLFWPNGWMDQRGRQLSAHICCGQMAAWIKMPFGTELGLGLCDIVLDVDPAPPPLGGHSPPQFSANVRCVQTAVWTNMPLVSMEVGLGPGDFVFDVDRATTSKKGTPTPSNFWSMSTVPKQLDGSRCHLVRR